MDLQQWLAFTSIAFIATAVPGPAILLVSSHCLQFGLCRALFTITGNLSGLVIMSACSILGLTALVAVSTTAFTVLKFTGAIYLVCLGIKVWRSGVALKPSAEKNHNGGSGFSLYVQGIAIALTNPKAIVFTSALFPQFIELSSPLLPQFLPLVATLMLCSFVCLFSYANLAKALKQSSGRYISTRTLGKLFGSSFIAAGGALALSGQK